MQTLSINKTKKREVVADASKLYGSAGNWVFIFSYTGLGAAKTQELRSGIKNAGNSMVVMKNTLNSIAMKDSGFGHLCEFLSGQVATVFGNDPVSAAKILYDFHKNKNIELIAYSDGKSVYNLESLEALAKLPSLDVLRAKLLGMLLSVPTKFVSVLSEPSRALARVLDARAKKSS